MAFPNIDPTTPSGSDKKKFGDDQIRTLKQAVIDILKEISNYPAGTKPALKTAVWTTATRPTGSELVDRVTGYNTTLGYEEYYDLTSTTWKNKSTLAATATKLATARTISLIGDVTGSATFDGSANAAITATVENDSHSHTAATLPSIPSATGTHLWVSSEYTPALGLLAVNHGISGLDPKTATVEICFKCTTADAGYAVGDILSLASAGMQSGYPAAQHIGLTSTQIFTTFGYTAKLYLRNKSTGAYVQSDYANWTVFFRVRW